MAVLYIKSSDWSKTTRTFSETSNTNIFLTPRPLCFHLHIPHSHLICDQLHSLRVNQHVPRSGSCCLFLLLRAGLGMLQALPAQALGPAPGWPCYCPCYEVLGEPIFSTGDCTASSPLLHPHLLPASPHMSKRYLREQGKKWKVISVWSMLNHIKAVMSCGYIYRRKSQMYYNWCNNTASNIQPKLDLNF